MLGTSVAFAGLMFALMLTAYNSTVQATNTVWTADLEAEQEQTMTSMATNSTNSVRLTTAASGMEE